MKFKEIILLANVTETLDILREYYYKNPEDDVNVDYQIESYKDIIDKLILMEHESSDKVSENFDTTKNDWRICLELILPDGHLIEEPYITVFAKNGTLQKETEEYHEFLKEKCDKEWAESEVTYAIEFTPWSQWLGMDIDQHTLEQFPKEEILAHCLFEMTFISWDEEEIQSKMDELNQQVNDIKNGKSIGKEFKNVDGLTDYLKNKLDEEENQ